MRKIIWKLLKMIDNNWGYSTPLQERFEIGSKVKISNRKTSNTKFNIGEEVTILETGRHDYLVENVYKVKGVVYQFELK